MRSKSFAALAAWSAFVAGAAGLLYAVSFVILQNVVLSAVFLLLGGLASLVVWTGLYEHFRDAQPPFALLALILSLGAAAGALIHGGYDLSNALHPPAAPNTDLPNAVDPRGLLTFGVAAIGLFIFAWLASQDKRFPQGLVYLGYASAVLMAILYLGRLIILQATSPIILIPALLEGFLVNPIWLIWLGVVFRRMAK
jgi:hypothetical protein